MDDVTIRQSIESSVERSQDLMKKMAQLSMVVNLNNTAGGMSALQQQFQYNNILAGRQQDGTRSRSRLGVFSR